MPNSAAVPSELHFIWLGSHLPKKYLITLLQLIPIARRSGFKINLWVDHSSNYYQALDRYSNSVDKNIPDLDLSAQSSFLQIKELAELKHEMKSHEFFLQKNTHTVNDEIKAGAFTRSQDRYSDFWQYVDREMIGAKNLAAASDLLRYAILYLKGGYYFDTDTKFDFFNIIRDKNRKWIIQSVLLDEKYKLCADQFDLGFSSVWGRNDILAALPEHPILEITIESALDAYNDYDKLKLTDSMENEKTEMDKKRYNHSNPKKDDPRLKLTMESSGVSLLTILIEEFGKVVQALKKSQLDTLAKKHELLTSKKVSFANLSIDIAETSDLTWMKSDDKIPAKSFDDSAIHSRSRHGFFTHQAEENKSNSDKQVSQQTLSSPTLRN